MQGMNGARGAAQDVRESRGSGPVLGRSQRSFGEAPPNSNINRDLHRNGKGLPFPNGVAVLEHVSSVKKDAHNLRKWNCFTVRYRSVRSSARQAQSLLQWGRISSKSVHLRAEFNQIV
jgi:hypothetical protein